MKRGYITIAANSVEYYHHAINLAVSIKANREQDGKGGSALPFALICCGEFLHKIAPQDLKVFDEIITLNPRHNHQFYYKTRLIEYSPFEQTIFLDADSLCIANPDGLFDLLDGSPFYAVINRKGEFTAAGDIKMQWAKPQHLYTYYDVSHDRTFYELQNSLIYFDKSREAKDIFILAEHFYASEFYADFKGLAPHKDMNAGLGHFPDELAFEVALLHTGTDIPNVRNPIYFDYGKKSGGYFAWTKAAKEYPFFSLPGGSGNNTHSIWEAYNNLRTLFARDMSMQLFGSYAAAFNSGTGYKLTEKTKAANTVPRYRYDGLRKRSRPARIKKIIAKYKEKQE